MAHWKFMPFQESEVGGEELLDHTDLEVGCLEVLWRTRPPCTVMLPVQLPPLLMQRSAKQPEDDIMMRTGLTAHMKAKADRARLLLVPVYASDHFTLLVLKRWSQVEGQESEVLPAQQRYTNPRLKQPDQDALVFNQLSRPKLA